MTTIQNEIVEQLLAKLAADKVMDAERLTKFRDLITTGKVKVEDLIALFSMPFAEVK